MLDHSKEPLLQRYLRRKKARSGTTDSQDDSMDALSWAVVVTWGFCAVMLVVWFWVGVVKPNPYVQRFVYDNPTCRGYAPDIELMIEKQLLAQKIMLVSQLGIGQDMQTDIELSNVRLESRDAVTWAVDLRGPSVQVQSRRQHRDRVRNPLHGVGQGGWQIRSLPECAVSNQRRLNNAENTRCYTTGIAQYPVEFCS